MHETNTACMKTDTAVGVAARRTVLQITSNGTPHGRQLAANLMMASCMKVHLKQVVVIGMT